ncbi:MAG: hypothetical protein Q7U91_06160 [Sideroxyarcus sp.]|nr:hypothetical protein [Sideroxyarcus sp.]
MQETTYLSTTKLAEKFGMQTKDLFAHLAMLGLISQNEGVWDLTDAGKGKGGIVKESKQHGPYIAWPSNVDLNLTIHEALITATAIGKHFDLSAIKANYILSELGWIKKSIKGWALTTQGAKLGGVQDEDKTSGIPFVRWPESIVTTKALLESMGHITGKAPEKKIEEVEKASEEIGFREKFEAKHRTADGHFVRSKAEQLIDNWLYMAEIVHAYERKLPIEEDVYSDFYIPTGKVYLEFWGLENDPKYLARKKQKIEIYSKYGFNLIELSDKEVQNLDDHLPRLLLKYGVQAY